MNCKHTSSPIICSRLLGLFTISELIDSPSSVSHWKVRETDGQSQLLSIEALQFLYSNVCFFILFPCCYTEKGTFLSTMWTFGHISLWVYCRLLSGWVDMFSMPTKVTYQIVLLLRLLVWKHDNLHIGVKVVNTKYLQNTLFSLIYPVLGPRWSVPFDFS